MESAADTCTSNGLTNGVSRSIRAEAGAAANASAAATIPEASLTSRASCSG